MLTFLLVLGLENCPEFSRFSERLSSGRAKTAKKSKATKKTIAQPLISY